MLCEPILRNYPFPFILALNWWGIYYPPNQARRFCGGKFAMSIHTVTVQLPEPLYLRLQQTAQATQQSFEEILLRAVQVDCRKDSHNSFLGLSGTL